jgi:hypothetical protein
MSMGRGSWPAGCSWGAEDGQPAVPGARKTTSRFFLGLGRRPAGYLWVTEDGQPDVPGSRKTTTHLDAGSCPGSRKTTTHLDAGSCPGSRKTTSRISLGHGRRPRIWMRGGAAKSRSTTIVPAASGAEPPELDVPCMKKGRVSFFRRM